MASVSQSPWLCTVRPTATNVTISSTKSKPRNLSYKSLKVSSSSSNAEPSPPNSSNPAENPSEAEPSKSDRIKMAFAKAKAYKEAKKLNPTPKIVENPGSDYAETGIGNDGSNEEVPLSVGIAMEKAKEYGIKKDVFLGGSGIAEKSGAFSGTRKDGFVSEVTTVDNQEVPPPLKLAMEKAKEYQKNKGVTGSGLRVEDSQKNSGLKGRDWLNSEEAIFERMISKKDDPKSSSVDFMGLDFADKKKSGGLPSGFIPVAEPKTTEEGDPDVYEPKISTWGASPSHRNVSTIEGDFPEVEILVGDPTKFGTRRVSQEKSAKEDESGVYKPKVSTWGGSPCNRNVSKIEGDFPEVEILVGDPSKLGTPRVSQEKSAEEDNTVVYEPKFSPQGGLSSPRNVLETRENFPEVEILVGDPSKFGAFRVSEPKTIEEDDPDDYKPKVSTWGGSPSYKNMSKTEGDFPEVEILVGDPSKFGSTTVSEPNSTDEDDPDVYKPKISTWGASPSTRSISKTEGDFPEVEILVGDPSRFGKTTVSKPKTAQGDNSKVYKTNVPTFGASLSPTNISKTEGDFPKVKILGNPTKFGTTALEPKSTKEDDPDIYIPKVSSWGVFPRPRNISKAYGGGRTIRPGEVLETAEVQAAKNARTRELVAEYRRKRDSSIDPKLISECEEVLKDGDSLMNIGKLKEALPFYETVMDKIPFQNELHGLAALHWAICQDSLTRHKEARIMYEKLKSHSNVNVKKTARHFAFSFQAMAMMKVKSTTLAPINLGYQNYFEAFVGDKANYPLKDAEVEDSSLNQVIPYIVFLASPLLMVLLIALQKRI
ncbi:hypothetical protein Vadar_024923 [Vaccinium darrowii]|uniref:Uncharacterized protein n=1 Tax=Vaccinium darrowii TaxID=229202 RepID=A0ACB7ZDR0_9ERIC|nr:hypothetical protein Vadar_024923 [Vaccinium darrowii]